MTSLAKRLGRNLETEKRDAAEAIKALSLQARAWRQLALIALVDQEWARKRAGWLFFQTVPFVNGPELEAFVAESYPIAEKAGKEAGVFGLRDALT